MKELINFLQKKLLGYRQLPEVFNLQPFTDDSDARKICNDFINILFNTFDVRINPIYMFNSEFVDNITANNEIDQI